MPFKPRSIKIILSMFAIIFLALSGNASAIGISPGRIIMDFSPNMEGVIDFCVINNEHKEFAADIYVKGDLADYITLNEKTYLFSPSTDSACLSFAYKLPKELPPGHHDSRIGAVESTATGNIEGTGVAARVGVEMQWWVEAPFPGKFVTGTLSVPETSLVGKQVPIKLILKNAGKEPISAAKGVIDILGPQGEQIVRYEFPSISLAVAESKEQVFSWPGAPNPGEYTAKATIFYEGVASEIKRKFLIGDLFIKITKLRAAAVAKGGIQALPIELQSFWNSKIDNVYAEVTIKTANGTVVAANLRSDIANIPPWGVTAVTAFWDTTNAETGKYTAEVRAFYQNRTSDASFNFDVVEKKSGGIFSSGSSALTLFIILDIAVIILIIAAVVFYFRKIKSSA